MAMAVNKVVYNAKVLLDLTSDTVTPAMLAKGVTAHDKSGTKITGTMPATVAIDTNNNIILSGELADGKYTVMIGDTVVGSYTQGATYTNMLSSSLNQ